MKIKRGKFIVLEGTDGTGKATQAKLLRQRLEKEGHRVVMFDFPQYDEASSYFVKEYLNGKYGTIDDVGPYRASIFYALDRFSARDKIETALDKGYIALSNRYVGSNMGHQGAKFESKEERGKYFKWLYELEFKILEIPKPDLSFVLHVPAEVSQKLVDKKDPRQYTEKTRDLHEGDLAHLRKAEKVYLEIAELFPRSFKVTRCMKGDILMSPKEILEKIWQKVQKIL